ncbi:MAG: YggT family protein [Fibrobacterota bacterium]
MLIQILVALLRVYEMLIFMRIILSWVPGIDSDSKIVVWLIRVTDPVLQPARDLYMRVLERFNVNMPIDLSPILIFLVIGFLQRMLMTLSF